MYIRSVKIKNYRTFGCFEVALSRLSIIIGENEAGKTNLFDALALPLNSNDISFNRKRLSVSDINRDAIIDFYQAIIDKRSDDDIKKLIPEVNVEIEFTDPQGAFQEKVVSKWLFGDVDDNSYKIRYESAPKDEDDFIKVSKEALKDAKTIDDTHWFTLPVEQYEYTMNRH